MAVRRVLISGGVDGRVKRALISACRDTGWQWTDPAAPDHPAQLECDVGVVSVVTGGVREGAILHDFMPPNGRGVGVVVGSDPPSPLVRVALDLGHGREFDARQASYELRAASAAWLSAIDAPAQPASPARGLIEALYREVHLGLVENEYLRALIADLIGHLAGVTEQLTEAQLEIRTLEALHARLEKQNEALLKELSKGRVQPESASLLARGIKFGAVSLVSLAITVGGTYAGTKAALPDEQAAQLQQTQQVIVQQCDQVIQALEGGG